MGQLTEDTRQDAVEGAIPGAPLKTLLCVRTAVEKARRRRVVSLIVRRAGFVLALHGLVLTAHVYAQQQGDQFNVNTRLTAPPKLNEDDFSSGCATGRERALRALDEWNDENMRAISEQAKSYKKTFDDTVSQNPGNAKAGQQFEGEYERNIAANTRDRRNQERWYACLKHLYSQMPCPITPGWFKNLADCDPWAGSEDNGREIPIPWELPEPPQENPWPPEAGATDTPKALPTFTPGVTQWDIPPGIPNEELQEWCKWYFYFAREIKKSFDEQLHNATTLPPVDTHGVSKVKPDSKIVKLVRNYDAHLNATLAYDIVREAGQFDTTKYVYHVTNIKVTKSSSVDEFDLVCVNALKNLEGSSKLAFPSGPQDVVHRLSDFTYPPPPNSPSITYDPRCAEWVKTFVGK